jgi:putative transposase
VDNAFIESFNGRLRDECLNTIWYYGLEHAREVINEWIGTTTNDDPTARSAV